MNGRALTIALVVVFAFLLGWTCLRFGGRQTQADSQIREAVQNADPATPPEVSLQVAVNSNRPSKLGDERVSRITDILERRDKQIAEIKQRANGFETEADRRQVEQINQAAEEQLKAILTQGESSALQVEQFKETDLGKALVQHFTASDAELAAISEHEKAIAEVIANKGDLESVQTQSLERLEKILGTERLNEYLNYRDPDYVEAMNFAKRFNLRPDTATELMKLRAEHGRLVLERLREGKPGNGLSEPFRSRVTDLLGPEAGEIYMREAKGGLWLR